MSFNPSHIGRVGAPHTEEAHNRRAAAGRRNLAAGNASGRTNRRGIPHGWNRARAEAASKAASIAADALANVMLEPLHPELEALRLKQAEPHVGLAARQDLSTEEWDALAGNEALRAAFALALDPTVPIRTRLSAAYLVLKYTMPLPVVRGEGVMSANGGVSAESGLNWLLSKAAAI